MANSGTYWILTVKMPMKMEIMKVQAPFFLSSILFFCGSSHYAIFIFNVRSLKAWNWGLGMVTNVVIWILVAKFYNIL
jgi:hypothetical protein